MLFDREFPISDDVLLYHYCSPETLVSIIQNRTIRFSDMNMMNDAEEGRWGYRIWIEAANKLLDPDNPPPGIPEPVTKDFIDHIDEIWSSMSLGLSSFIASFSKDGDSLSQWRAYADDGRGYAIGFRSTALRRLPIQLLDVCYEREKQIQEMVIAIGATFLEWLDKGKDYDQPWFRERCQVIAMSSAAFKNPAWRDEQEVRCQHAVTVTLDEDGLKLIDDGGVSEGKDVDGVPIQFQVRNGSMVPFLDLTFDQSRGAIAEIVMGPKCQNAPGNVLFLLGNSGYGVLPIRAAGAAYR